MKSVKSSCSETNTVYEQQCNEIVNEATSVDDEKQLYTYWNNIFEILLTSDKDDKIHSVIKRLYTISARIGQSLAKSESNMAISEWALIGLKCLQARINETNKAALDKEKYIQTMSLFQRVMVILRKSIQKYFEKPHSNTNIEHKKAEISEYSNSIQESLQNVPSVDVSQISGELQKWVNLDNVTSGQQSTSSNSLMNNSSEVARVSIIEESKNLDPPISEVNQEMEVMNDECVDPKLQITTVPSIVTGSEDASKPVGSPKSSDSGDLTDCRTVNSISPISKGIKFIGVRSESDDDTDDHSGKSSPDIPPFSGYPTRLALKKHKRKYRQKINIKEHENDVKEFYKRRKITTDFEFNPRFDKPKKSSKKKRDQKNSKQDDPILFITEKE